MNDSITILDGGMGRELKKMGAPFRQPEWSALALMEAPEMVRTAHENFIAAGADIITTNSYAVSPLHIGAERFARDGRDLIALAARLAREAANNAPRDIKVAGCIPPMFGSYDADAFDIDKAPALLTPMIEEQSEHVDIWLAETISSFAEAKAINDLLQKLSPHKPFWLAYTLKEGESVLPSGEDIATITKRTSEDLNAAALLFNCCQIEDIEPALKIARQNTTLTLGAYGNAFVPVDDTRRLATETSAIREDTTPEVYLKHANRWKALGATIIGGCCGIGPEHIHCLHTNLR